MRTASPGVRFTTANNRALDAMIRYRIDQMGSAVARAIEMLQRASCVDEVAPAVVELLGRAAASERAVYWAVDPEQLRLRAFTRWGAQVRVGDSSARERAAFRAGIRSHVNAAHVWRSRRPLWSADHSLAAGLSASGGAGLFVGVWFAVQTDTSRYGVVELCGRALAPKAPDNLAWVERLGFRLGYALELLRYQRMRMPPSWQGPGRGAP